MEDEKIRRGVTKSEYPKLANTKKYINCFDFVYVKFIEDAILFKFLLGLRTVHLFD